MIVVINDLFDSNEKAILQHGEKVGRISIKPSTRECDLYLATNDGRNYRMSRHRSLDEAISYAKENLE